ncbi:MAG: YciI family protein [Acidimicrobiales bacterium]
MSNEPEEIRTAEPPLEFDTYEIVILRVPDGRQPLDPEAAKLMHRRHLGHLAAMRESGMMKAAGPLESRTDESLAGICLYQTGSEEEARRLAESDPAVQARRFVVEVMTWSTPKGTIAF